MRKLLLLLFTAFFLSNLSQAQVRVKAGINCNSPNLFDNVPGFRFEDPKTSMGYHVGVSFTTKLPVGNLYLRPEIIFSVLKNDIVYDFRDYFGFTPFGLFLPESTSFSLSKIDIPILIEKRILKIGSVFVGPSLHHVVSSNIDITAVNSDSSDNFFLGIHIGGEIRLGRVGMDVRWEKSITNSKIRFTDNRSFLNALDIGSIEGDYFDGKSSQLIVSIFYTL